MNLDKLRKAIDGMPNPSAEARSAAVWAMRMLHICGNGQSRVSNDTIVRALDAQRILCQHTRREYALAILIEAEDFREGKRKGWKQRDGETLRAGRYYRGHRAALHDLREIAAKRIRELRADVLRLDNAVQGEPQ